MIETDRKARLITSDAPLIVWRQPSRRDEYEGVGIAWAEEIRFPLDSSKQLVIRSRERPPTARIDPARVRSCNADIASACHQFIVAHPRNVNEARAVELTRARPGDQIQHWPAPLRGRRAYGGRDPSLLGASRAAAVLTAAADRMTSRLAGIPSPSRRGSNGVLCASPRPGDPRKAGDSWPS